MTHIFVDNLTIIGSDNGLSPGRRQAIIWTNAGILLIGPLGTSFSEILLEIHTFSFTKMHLKMSSGKWRPFCVGLNVLTFTMRLLAYFGPTWPMSWLLMALPPQVSRSLTKWYKYMSLVSRMSDFQRHILYHFNVREWYKMQINILFSHKTWKAHNYDI